MPGWDRIAFNLLFNASTSFLAGLLLVSLSAKCFRIETSRWRLMLWLLPFVKILWDLGCGLPRDSILYGNLDPLALPPKHQTLSVGLGFSQWGPIFTVTLGALDTAGREYSTSLADYLWSWLAAHGGAAAPRWLLGLALSGSLLLLGRRLFSWLRFEAQRRSDRWASAPFSSLRVGWRRVDVYRSAFHDGTPFTGGWLRPYICLPESTLQRLSHEETRAALEHEIAHVRHHDFPIAFALRWLGDLFWFVPLYRFCLRRIDPLREILADKDAVLAGASAPHLASALVELSRLESEPSAGALYSALLGRPSLVKERVERLVGKAPAELSPRFGWSTRPGRWLFTLWTSGAVLAATLGGNAQIRQLPDWLAAWLRQRGWM